MLDTNEKKKREAEKFNLLKESEMELNKKFFYPKYPYRRIVKGLDINTNTDYEICSECKGECCRRSGCPFSPVDFEEISFKFLKKEIEKGHISIEFVPEDILFVDTWGACGLYFLRARNKNAPIVEDARLRMKSQTILPCILLRDDGCALDFEHRPSYGKSMIPSSEFHILENGKKVRTCPSKYSLEDVFMEWRPFQQIIYDLVEYFSDFADDYPCFVE